MKKINESLARFSSLITTLTTIGLVGVVFAAVIFFAGANARDAVVMGVAVFVVYVSGSTLSLAIFGVFLRLTAKAVIDGLDGNLIEHQFAATDITFQSDDSNPEDVDKTPMVAVSKHDRVLKSLTNYQRSKWQRARRPDLSDYDGSISFSIWLKAQPGRW